MHEYLQPTDSLTPLKLIQPGSPVRLQELCNEKKHTSSRDVSSEQEGATFGSAVESSTAEDWCVNGKLPLYAFKIILLYKWTVTNNIKPHFHAAFNLD